MPFPNIVYYELRGKLHGFLFIFSIYNMDFVCHMPVSKIALVLFTVFGEVTKVWDEIFATLRF